MTRPDQAARSPEGLARIFAFFGEHECPQLDAHLYRALCRGIAGDPDLLALAARAPRTQPAPNLLFGAVHFLLLQDEPHELRDWYPALAQRQAQDPSTAFPAFRSFCSTHADRIAALIETRLTQTNVIQRCSTLLPAFATVFEEQGRRPLALIEIGPSAGLNLLWDRYLYEYDNGAILWGDAAASVRIPCELRGNRGLPALPDRIPVATRCGVDIHPIDLADADAVLWLRALVWPDHVGRQERLTSAIAVARSHPPELVEGDASTQLGRLIASCPKDAQVCVYGTHTLYQFPKEALRRTLGSMQSASQERPVDFLSVEGTGERCSELHHTRYRQGDRETALVANCNPHGRWIEWLA